MVKVVNQVTVDVVVIATPHATTAANVAYGRPGIHAVTVDINTDIAGGIVSRLLVIVPMYDRLTSTAHCLLGLHDVDESLNSPSPHTLHEASSLVF